MDGTMRFISFALLCACASSAPLPAKAIALNQAGAEAAARGDLSTAEARLALALEYNPKFTEAWVNLGLVELRRGNLERANADFREARKLNEDLPTPHHGLGLVAERRGEALEAESYYRAALRVDPGFAAARINLARSLFARQKFEESRSEFLRLTQVAPDQVSGFAGLAETLLRLVRVAEAKASLDEAETRFPKSPELALVRGRVALSEERFDDARAALEIAATARDRFVLASALAHLGLLALGRGDRAEAQRLAARAGEQNKEDPMLAALSRELAK
jgi:Tfp pilus assembly protein PilF